MAKKYTITLDGILFNDVKRLGYLTESGPIGIENSHTYNNTTNTVTINTNTDKVFNAVDIYWNEAQLGNTTITTTGQLLNYILNHTSSGGNTSYVLPTASSTTLGGIKLGYSKSGNNYPVLLDTNGKAYVNVPDTDLNIYSAGTGININNNTISLKEASNDTLGGIKLGYSGNDKNYAVKTNNNGQAYVTVPWTSAIINVDDYRLPIAGIDTLGGIIAAGSDSLEPSIYNSTANGVAYNIYVDNTGLAAVFIPKASSNELGGIKLGYENDNNNKNYGVQIDNSGRAFVNVPWSSSTIDPDSPGSNPEENPDSNPTVKIVDEENFPNDCTKAEEGILYILSKNDKIIQMRLKIDGQCIDTYPPEPIEGFNVDTLTEEEYYQKKENGELNAFNIYIVKNGNTLVGLGLYNVLTKVPVPANEKIVELTKDEYQELNQNNQIDSTTIYYITDTNEIYIGNKKLSTTNEVKSEITNMFSEKFNFNDDGTLESINWGNINIDSDEFYAVVGFEEKINNIINSAGFISTANAEQTLASMFATQLDENGEIAKRADIIAYINNEQSEVKISADKINLLANNIIDLLYGDSNEETIGLLLLNASGLSSRVGDLEKNKVITNINQEDDIINLTLTFVDKNKNTSKTGTISLGIDDNKTKIILNADSIILTGNTTVENALNAINASIESLSSSAITTDTIKSSIAASSYLVLCKENDSNYSFLTNDSFYFIEESIGGNIKSTITGVDNLLKSDIAITTILSNNPKYSTIKPNGFELYSENSGTFMKDGRIYLSGEAGSMFINDNSLYIYDSNFRNTVINNGGTKYWKTYSEENNASSKLAISNSYIYLDHGDLGVSRNNGSYISIVNSNISTELNMTSKFQGNILKYISIRPDSIQLRDAEGDEFSLTISKYIGGISIRKGNKFLTLSPNMYGIKELSDDEYEDYIKNIEENRINEAEEILNSRPNIFENFRSTDGNEYKNYPIIFSKYAPRDYDAELPISYTKKSVNEAYFEDYTKIDETGLKYEHFYSRPGSNLILGETFTIDKGNILWEHGNLLVEDNYVIGYSNDNNYYNYGITSSGNAHLNGISANSIIIEGNEPFLVGQFFTINNNPDLDEEDTKLKVDVGTREIKFVTSLKNTFCTTYEFCYYNDEGFESFADIECEVITCYSVVQASDKNLKNILSDTTLTVEQIASAPAVNFLWKNKNDSKVNVGTIAQYWQDILPEVVSENKGTLAMNYSNAAMVSSIVTAKEVVTLKNKIEELEAENTKLKIRLALIEEKLGL